MASCYPVQLHYQVLPGNMNLLHLDIGMEGA